MAAVLPRERFSEHSGEESRRVPLSDPGGSITDVTASRRDLLHLAEAQLGLVNRADLDGVGVNRHLRGKYLADGTLIPIGRQTFRIGGVPITEEQAALAACLDTGGVLSHRSAAWLHRLPGFTLGHPPEVLVARPRFDYRLELATVHTTTWLPATDRIVAGGLPGTSVARTLFSLASLVPELPLDRARGAVDDAIRLGKATDGWLWWRLERLRCRGRTGVSAFESILAARSGGEITESWLERELLRVLRRGGLPLPACQARIGARGAFVARVDFLYPTQRLAIEVTGHQAHSTREQRAADARRRNRLQSAGLRVLEFTYEHVVREPNVVTADVTEALARTRAA
jgi:very-short-patch-repair endonuclease